jgi:hypothetical protein
MPIVAALPAIIGGVAALSGGIGGATNPRPPSLDPTQRGILDSLLPKLYGTLGSAPKIDPTLQAGMFGDIAAGGVGGANRVTNALVSRGLGRSGLLAQGLTQNSNQVSANQNSANQFLENQAIQQRNTTIQQIMSLLGITNMPGQSGASGFFSGFGSSLGPLAYALAKGGGKN